MDELNELEEMKRELVNEPHSIERLAIILTKLVMLSEVRVDTVHQITRSLTNGNESVINACREEVRMMRENRDALEADLKNALAAVDALSRRVESLLRDNKVLNNSLAETIAQNSDLIRTVQIVAQSRPSQTMNYTKEK